MFNSQYVSLSLSPSLSISFTWLWRCSSVGEEVDVADGFDDGDELAGGVNDVDKIGAFFRQSMSVMTE